jgi:hypothetical protein
MTPQEATVTRVTDAEQIADFLTELRNEGIDPGILAPALRWLGETGGTYSASLNKILDVVRSAVPVRDRAKRVATLVGQIFARDTRNF